eukprot:CAMPEP_0203924130 /NCGR_PEP_ID=MMETSP0359-20131031/63928_1 /ASSEMBLY_ACC=CAM_ASM_000338 /TAXON_ID=268821 /ORGANISM="Scrippsiella Hangoei, Strain SHTV-5" /LENGTH=46 /DNA_ID= /DNA_START= /DNA_END= /DNA_ORIENTATION=
MACACQLSCTPDSDKSTMYAIHRADNGKHKSTKTGKWRSNGVARRN